MSATVQLNPATIIQRNEDNFLSSALGDEIVMMNMEKGDYLGINSVGADIWNLLSEQTSVSALIEKIKGIYDVSDEQCVTEVNAFLSKMLEQDMLIVNG